MLLDPEARAGDDPAEARADDGMVREPALHRSAIFRALGCQHAPDQLDQWRLLARRRAALVGRERLQLLCAHQPGPGQQPAGAQQKLLVASEFTERLGQLNWIRSTRPPGGNDLSAYTNAGCSLDALVKAFSTSPRTFNNYSARPSSAVPCRRRCEPTSSS